MLLTAGGRQVVTTRYSRGMQAADRDPSERARARWSLATGAAAVILSVLLGELLAARQNAPFAIDTAWMADIVAHRSAALSTSSLVMNFIGGGWFGVLVVPSLSVLGLGLLRRREAATYYAMAAVASALATQLLKHFFDRPRPPEMQVFSDLGSFPSGHVANAAMIAVALAMVFRRPWIFALGIAYTILMALSRTYLGAHWLSDTVGGALLGAGVAILVSAPLAQRLDRERTASGPTRSA